MSRTSKSIAIAALLLVGAPSVVAATGWSSFGSHEPDTPHDVNDHWMFQGTDTSSDQSVRMVYFNGFTAESGTGINPNVGTVATGTGAQGEFTINAMFGVWKDCNGDGFVGLGDQGLVEYRSE